jgi:serine/threonine-protein kinase
MTSWLKLGCAGVQALPEPGYCPKESITAMENIFGWAPSVSSPMYVVIDVNQQPPPLEESKKAIGPSFYGVYKAGPVTGELSNTWHRAPKGTKLTGHLWTHGDRLYGRYLWAHVPGKDKIPICLELGSFGEIGIQKEDGSKPGAFVVPREGPAFATREWR